MKGKVLLIFAIYSVLEKIFKTLEIELECCRFLDTFLHLSRINLIRRVVEIVFRYNVNEIPKCLEIH